MSEPRANEHLTAERVSRRDRHCQDCRGVIGRGERYHRLSLPPSAEMSSGHWWSIDVHAVCPVSVR